MKAPENTKISVVVPTLNEMGNIKQLLYRLHKSLTSRSVVYEAIVIDDGSTDSTKDKLEDLKKNYPVRVFDKKGKRGKAFSLLEGFKKAKYENLAMIDADLQYPPEALPEMIARLETGADIVVANRKKQYSGISRRILSRGFSFIFGRVLHGFKCDVQSGLKVFKKDVIERVELNPTSWAFDLEFLLKARNAGYKIASTDIVFKKRQSGEAKIGLLKGIFEIGLSAIRLRLKKAEIVRFLKKTTEEKGEGFHYKGVEFLHHSKLEDKETAFKRFTGVQILLILLVLGGITAGFYLNWFATVLFLIGTITVSYTFDFIFTLLLVFKGLSKNHEITVTESELAKYKNFLWPKYTILVPLYKEWQIVSQFVRSIKSLDYPKNKLQVLLLLEEDDKDTLEKVSEMNLPDYIQTLVVPHSLPKTKPKALNYGLRHAVGAYTVVYDAEDKPEKLQLKKAVIAFKKVKADTVCVQAKLNYYNPRQNLLTKLFTAEYSLWFDVILPGFQAFEAPIPLGGTSNHFRTKVLKKVKGWDSFNVTEDADLGIRLAQAGYRTQILESTTYEEAASNLKLWFNQRTRWIKGYLQTYFVHMRRPKESFKKYGLFRFFIMQLVLGGKALFMILNPFLWATTYLYFAYRDTWGLLIEKFFPGPLLYLGVISLFFGNFLYFYSYMIATVKRKQYDLTKYVFFIPFYWLLLSITTWRAFFQLLTRPHFWPKTTHGFHFKKKKVLKKASVPAVVQLPHQNPSWSFTKVWSFKNLSRSGFLAVCIGVSSVLNFVFNAYFGRVLPLESFAVLNLTAAFGYVFAVLFDSLSTATSHKVSYLLGRKNETGAAYFAAEILLTVLKPVFLVSCIIVLLSPLITQFFHLDSLFPVLLLVPMLVFGIADAIIGGFLAGSFFFFSYGFIFLLLPFTKLLSGFLINYYRSPSLVYFAVPISLFVTFIFYSLIFFLKLRKINRAKAVAAHQGFPRKVFFGNIASSLGFTIFFTSDIFLMQHFMSAKLAGEYGLLSLVGKIIFFSGSLANIFMVPFVSRDLGARKKTDQTFFRLFSLTALIGLSSFVVVGVFGDSTLPLLFGEKIRGILPYVFTYSFAVFTLTLTSSIVAYHLARKQILSPLVTLASGIGMTIGIFLFHGTINEVVYVILVTSLINLVSVIVLHFLYERIRFFLRGIYDFISVFMPIPLTVKESSGNLYKKKILIFNWRDTKHVFAGGAEVYVHELAKRWVREGNKVTLFSGNDGKEKRHEIIDGVEIVRRGGFYLVYLWAFLYYTFRFRGKYDVVIDCENGIPFFTPLYVKEKVYLLIHHVHQEVFRKSLIFPFSAIALLLEGKIMPLVYKKIQFITVSNSSKKEILDHKLSTIEPVVIHNGVDLESFRPAPKSKTPLVVYVGRLQYYKSINVLLKAAKEVLGIMPQVRFVIAGDGEEKTNLMKYAKRIDLNGEVRFAGKVSEKEKVDLYQKAWVFVNPSYLEGWGITTIEANACGTPVVASAVNGLKDSVQNPHTGYLVKYGEAHLFAEKIVKLLKEKELREKMSDDAIDWAKRFNWEKSAEIFMDLIERDTQPVVRTLPLIDFLFSKN